MLFRNTLLSTLALFSGFSLVHAGDVLSTDGFTTCDNGTDIKVEKFHVKYDRSTMKVTFDVAGTSKSSQDVIAKLVVTAYGKEVYQREFDPCKEKIKFLCPGRKFSIYIL